MDITYKLVSDWNLKVDFSESEDTGGIVPIASDSLFSSNNNGGSYSIEIDSSDVRHGVFSQSSTYLLSYFTYSNDNLSFENIEVNKQQIKGISPQLGINSSGNPVVLYYDLNSFAIALLERVSGEWSVSYIDYINMQAGSSKRNISMKIVGTKIYISYVYKFDEEQFSLQIAYYDGSKWTIETVANDDGEREFISTSIVLDSNNNMFIFVGTTLGLSVYRKLNGSWSLAESFSENASVSEITAVYDQINGYTHISYICNSESRYQKYNHNLSALLDRFLSNYKFIDFNSNSVSIDIDSNGNPLISYSHVEQDVPVQVFLKIARSSSYGDVFKTYPIDLSSVSLYTGYLSDVKFDSNDKICILYYSGSVKLYDEKKDIDEDNVATSSWKDRKFVNNLTASDSPPTRDSQNTYMEFTSINKQCFYIDNEDMTDLDESLTSFSILFTIIPKGLSTTTQTIVSKSDSGKGYEVFLGGSSGLTLSASINTVYDSIEVSIVDLIADQPAKIGIVYSGYDLKVYVKNPYDEVFSVYKYDIFGDVKRTNSPFVIGAHGVKNISSQSTIYPYPTPSDSYTFSNFLDAKLTGLKYWKRELSYEEASYSDFDLISYDNSIDPYSDNIDYSTYHSSFGTRHFAVVGNSLGVVDYGGIDKINMLSYSNFDAEDRVTNSTGYSIDPFVVKKQKGGMLLVWSDNKTGYSEIYADNFESNHSTKYLSEENSVLRCHGRNGRIVAGSNIFCDPKSDFISSGVYIGDFLCITSGSDYVGRRVPVIGVVNKTCVEIGAYFTVTSDDVGYYIDSINGFSSNDIPTKITNLSQTSVNPIAVCDSINDLHVVFQSIDDDNYNLYYQRYRPSNSSNQLWGSTKLISSIGESISPSLAIDSSDIMHLVWEDTRNKSHSIMYGMSSSTTSDGNSNFVNWTTSNFGSDDVVISDGYYSEKPNIHIDSDNIAHIVFSARINNSDNSKYEIYYCNNANGVFSKPIRITNFMRRSNNPVIITDKNMNRYILFSCKQSSNIEDVYMAKYDYVSEEWKSIKKVSFSQSDSIIPSVCMDSDDVIYIYWIDKADSSNSVCFARYNSSLDRFSYENIRPSSYPSTVIKVSAEIDESKTVYLAWEDGRFGNSVGTEIYKNESINLINFDKIKATSDSTDKTDDEIVSDQLNKFVIGKKYSDDASQSELPESAEALSDVVITLETDSVTYSVPVDIFNSENPLATQETIILDSRDISIKIKGLQKTLAYRIKNADDSSASYSEFYEFSIDVFPNTTIANWRLSAGNGAKRVAIELYTVQGLTAPINIDLYLNEPDIYDISFFNNSVGSVGEAVNTTYQDVTVLSYNTYWVKIKPHKVIDNSQEVKFDIETLGTNLSNIPTTFDGEYYVGKFSVNTHDGVRYMDGGAKIVPKVVAK